MTGIKSALVYLVISLVILLGSGIFLYFANPLSWVTWSGAAVGYAALVSCGWWIVAIWQLEDERAEAEARRSRYPRSA